MKKKVYEEIVLFYSLLKWFILASIIGVIVGISTSVFLKLLNWSIMVTSKFNFYFLLLPVAFFLSVVITNYLAPEAEGHGTEKVIEAIHKNNGKIKISVVPVKLIVTIISIAFGGSAGKEGPSAQIGAGLASGFAELFKFNEIDRKKLVICGISAGFAAVFGTPIAGAIFGVEVLFVGRILYDILFPSFIAGMISFQVASLLGIKYLYFPINFNIVFNELFFLEVLFSGVFFGLCSLLLIESLIIFKKFSNTLNIWKPFKGLIGGFILIILTFLLSNQYLGLGISTIENALKGQHIDWYAFLAKTVFTCITLNFGGSGGIITPIFFIGSTSGNIFADVFKLDRAVFASIGMVSLLAGAANTPIAASIMAIELFGPRIAPYAAAACIISFIMTGHRSVYPSQMLGVRKSILIDIELNKEISDLSSDINVRKDLLLNYILDLFDRLTIFIKKYFKKNKPKSII